MAIAWQLITALFLKTFILNAQPALAQTANERDNLTHANPSLSPVDMFAKHAPGKYEHFDLLYLLDYRGLKKFSSPSDTCPNIMALRNFSKVDNNTADLEFTQLVLDNMSCSATPFTSVSALKFIRIHLDMFFNPQHTPSAEMYQDETPYQHNPLQESIGHLRSYIDDNMFQWYAHIQPDTVRCLPGIDSVEEGSMFVIDAHKFFSLLLDSIQTLAGERQQPPLKIDPRTHQESMQGASPGVMQNDSDANIPADGTILSSSVLKNMSGHYFFSYMSLSSSCFYVHQRDVQMLRDAMRSEEHKTMEGEKTTYFLKPGMVVAAAPVCDCGDDYPRMVEVHVLNQTQLPNVETETFSEKFFSHIKATLSAKSWTRTISHRVGANSSGAGPVPKLVVKFDGMECAVSRVLALSDIVHKIERPSFESDLPQNDTAKSTKVREFVEAAMILKYFQEITGQQNQQVMDTIPLEAMLEMSSQMMLAADKVSQVLVIDAGSKCGPHVVERDIVVLVEHRHIFEQVRHLPIFHLINSKFIERLLGFDDESRRFTIHILQDKDEGITSCSYASSEGAVALLSPQCQAFHALGSGGFRYRKNSTFEGDTSNPSEEPGSEGNEPSEENKQKGSETPQAGTTGEQNAAKEKMTAEPDEPTNSPWFEDSSQPPTASPTPSAIPSGNSGSNRGGGMCFPSDALVTLEDGTTVPMTALKVGDMVADGTGGTSKVLVFAHQDYLTLSEFVRIVTSHGVIELSPSHYVYTHRGLVTADGVHVDDLIETVVGTHTGFARVTELSRETKVGLFNPITVSGSIAVTGNGNDAMWVSSNITAFKASCFTSIVDVATSATLVAPLRWIQRFFGISVPGVSAFFKNGNRFWPLVLNQGPTNVSGMVRNL